MPTCSARRASSARRDRKSTRLNSSHVENSYAVFCLKKKKKSASKKTRITIHSLLALFCFVKGLLQLRNIVIKQLEVVGDFLFSAHRRHQHDDPRAGFTGDGVRCFQIEVRFHGDDLDPFAFHQAHQLYRMLRAWGNAWPRLHVTNDVEMEMIGKIGYVEP